MLKYDRRYVTENRFLLWHALATHETGKARRERKRQRAREKHKHKGGETQTTRRDERAALFSPPPATCSKSGIQFPFKALIEGLTLLFCTPHRGVPLSSRKLQPKSQQLFQGFQREIERTIPGAPRGGNLPLLDCVQKHRDVEELSGEYQ